MSRLINADRLLFDVSNAFAELRVGKREILREEDILKMIYNAPAVEHKEQVTCKDCMWLYLHDGFAGVCENRFGLNSRVSPQDYCSRGKRREQVSE